MTAEQKNFGSHMCTPIGRLKPDRPNPTASKPDRVSVHDHVCALLPGPVCLLVLSNHQAQLFELTVTGSHTKAVMMDQRELSTSIDGLSFHRVVLRWQEQTSSSPSPRPPSSPRLVHPPRPPRLVSCSTTIQPTDALDLPTLRICIRSANGASILPHLQEA